MDKAICPHCNSNKTHKNGFNYGVNGAYQIYKCNSCNHHFTERHDQTKQYSFDLIKEAVQLKKTGKTYRDIAIKFRQDYGVSISHSTIIRWFNTCYSGKTYDIIHELNTL